jgi:hypothetical protein
MPDENKITYSEIVEPEGYPDRMLSTAIVVVLAGCGLTIAAGVFALGYFVVQIFK